MLYRRNFQPGATFFFTLVTYHRWHLFKNDQAVELFKNVVHEVKAQHPFDIVAWVILPDHLHMIWELPEDDSAYSKRWSKIKSLFTRRWLARKGTELPVSAGKQNEQRRGIWQPKFFEHTIRNEADLRIHIEYIHFNPVKHSLVLKASDWNHSSFTSYVDRGYYLLDWGCAGIENENDSLDTLPYIGFE